MRAWSFIREAPVYRREAFAAGLRAAGFTALGPDRRCADVAEPGEVMLIWNRYGDLHDLATRFERRGGLVLVAENGYVGNDRSNRQVYALARGAHNGAGTWMLGGPERWAALGVKMDGWRDEGDHILICPNRSFGMPGFIMPPIWPKRVADELRAMTRRPVRVRPHPGNDPPRRALAEDLRDAWAVVIWSSSAGCEALLSGIPVFATAPWWIAMGATSGDLSLINNPPLPDRLPAFERLAWAQWNIKEIQSGEPFSYLCHDAYAFSERV